MKKSIFFVILFSNLFAANENMDLKLNEIYAQKKAEILREYEKIDTKRQEFEAYKAASFALFKARDENLSKKQENIKKMLDKINKKEENIKNLLAKNEELLKELKDTMQGKISQIYTKIKDNSGALILSQMPKNEAAEILYHLEPKKIAKILAKLDPLLAAQLTQILSSEEFLKDMNSSNYKK